MKMRVVGEETVGREEGGEWREWRGEGGGPYLHRIVPQGKGEGEVM